MASELVRSRQDLENIADLLARKITNLNGSIVSRYNRVVYDVATFINGQESEWRYCQSNVNKEMMERGRYTTTGVDDLLPHNIEEVAVARDLQDHRFHFSPKGIELPTDEVSFFELIPSNIDLYDDELRKFTGEHKNSRLTRTLTVEQRVIVNSKGGKTLQTIPLFGISYSHGYEPIPTSRDVTAVCTSEDDIRRFPDLIKFLADPTPERRIRNAKSFSEAFHELHKVSGLRYGSLEEAGIPLAGLYDVVILTGVPAHEVFGHHFEEPIRFLDFGESATFKYAQDIGNKSIILKDDPAQRIEGFRVQGFTFVDAYGRKREARTHIKDGKCLEFLGSEYADPEKLRQYLNLAKSKFVGNASQHTDGYFPQPRMSCTVLDGRIEDVDLEGKILLVSHEGHTQPSDKTYNVSAKECYVVRDGKPMRVIPLKVTGGINQALANIVLLDDWSYNTGFCGKPEPIYYPQSRGQASVPVSQFSRSQMWQEQQVYPLPISDVHLRVLTK